MANLTAKQQKFVDCYVQGMSQSDAYRAAYSCEAMSDRVIHNRASELAKSGEVAVRLSKFIEKRSERVNYDADKALVHLVGVVTAPFSQVYTTADGWLPVEDWPDLWQAMLQEIVPTAHGPRYVFVSRTKAIELLGKHVDVGAFAEKLQVEVIDRASVLDKAKKRVEKATHVH